MNERIKLLAEQALDAVQSRPNGTCDMNKYNQKFAELIVKDCLSIARSERNNMQFLASNPPQSAAAYDIERKIEKHFGVEE